MLISISNIGLEKSIVAENIAFLESQNETVAKNLDDKVALTLINIDEEATLKNFPNHTTKAQRQFTKTVLLI
jgi:hypothetical protein